MKRRLHSGRGEGVGTSFTIAAHYSYREAGELAAKSFDDIDVVWDSMSEDQEEVAVLGMACCFWLGLLVGSSSSPSKKKAEK